MFTSDWFCIEFVVHFYQWGQGEERDWEMMLGCHIASMNSSAQYINPLTTIANLSSVELCDSSSLRHQFEKLPEILNLVFESLYCCPDT